MRWPKHPPRRIVVSPEDIEWLNQWKWHVSQSGYVYRVEKRKSIWLHRLLMDAQPGEEIHHINHNCLDNRRENLRKVTRAEHAWIHSKTRRRIPDTCTEQE